MSGTFLGFDFGTKSIGVAVGQRITGTARPLPALKAQDGKPDWNIIEKLLKEWQPEAVIVGLPLNMDGTEQPLTARARNFANKIHGRFGVQIRLKPEPGYSNTVDSGRSIKAAWIPLLQSLFWKATSSKVSEHQRWRPTAAAGAIILISFLVAQMLIRPADRLSPVLHA